MTIVVAGATGLAGSAIVRAFEKAGKEVVGINRSVVDLLDLSATKKFLKDVAPSMVIDAAARCAIRFIFCRYMHRCGVVSLHKIFEYIDVITTNHMKRATE